MFSCCKHKKTFKRTKKIVYRKFSLSSYGGIFYKELLHGLHIIREYSKYNHIVYHYIKKILSYINVRFYLLEVPYPRKSCRITCISIVATFSSLSLGTDIYRIYDFFLFWFTVGQEPLIPSGAMPILRYKNFDNWIIWYV